MYSSAAGGGGYASDGSETTVASSTGGWGPYERLHGKKLFEAMGVEYLGRRMRQLRWEEVYNPDAGGRGGAPTAAHRVLAEVDRQPPHGVLHQAAAAAQQQQQRLFAAEVPPPPMPVHTPSAASAWQPPPSTAAYPTAGAAIAAHSAAPDVVQQRLAAAQVAAADTRGQPRGYTPSPSMLHEEQQQPHHHHHHHHPLAPAPSHLPPAASAPAPTPPTPAAMVLQQSFDVTAPRPPAPPSAALEARLGIMIEEQHRELHGELRRLGDILLAREVGRDKRKRRRRRDGSTGATRRDRHHDPPVPDMPPSVSVMAEALASPPQPPGPARSYPPGMDPLSMPPSLSPSQRQPPSHPLTAQVSPRRRRRNASTPPPQVASHTTLRPSRGGAPHPHPAHRPMPHGVDDDVAADTSRHRPRGTPAAAAPGFDVQDEFWREYQESYDRAIRQQEARGRVRPPGQAGAPPQHRRR